MIKVFGSLKVIGCLAHVMLLEFQWEMSEDGGGGCKVYLLIIFICLRNWIRLQKIDVLENS